MELKDILPLEAVLPGLRSTSKDEVLTELAEALAGLNPGVSSETIVHVLHERESQGSTAVGEGVAIPHAKIPSLKRLALVVGRSPDGIDFDAPDGLPCRLFFLILAPLEGAGQYLLLLSQVARRARDADMRSEMLLAKSREELWQIITAP